MTFGGVLITTQTQTQTVAIATSESKKGRNARPLTPPKWARRAWILHAGAAATAATAELLIGPLFAVSVHSASCTDEGPAADPSCGAAHV